MTLLLSSMCLETILSSGATLTLKLTHDARYQAFSMGGLQTNKLDSVNEKVNVGLPAINVLMFSLS